MLWQLKNLQTNEALNEAQKLPENWGPIFGMAGIVDRLGDLSWLGDAYANQGWVQVEEPAAPEATTEELTATAMSQIEHYILQSNPMVAADNTSMTRDQRTAWIEYRRLVRDIPLQVDFPRQINWPSIPA
jgi:hypothetical protein